MRRREINDKKGNFGNVASTCLSAVLLVGWTMLLTTSWIYGEVRGSLTSVIDQVNDQNDMVHRHEPALYESWTFMLDWTC